MKQKGLAALLGLSMLGSAHGHSIYLAECLRNDDETARKACIREHSREIQNDDCTNEIVYTPDDISAGTEKVLYDPAHNDTELIKASIETQGEDKVTLRVQSKFIDGQQHESLQELVVNEDHNWRFYEGLAIYLTSTNPTTICVGVAYHDPITRQEVSDDMDLVTAQLGSVLYQDLGTMTWDATTRTYTVVTPRKRRPKGITPERKFTIKEDLLEAKLDDVNIWIRAKASNSFLFPGLNAVTLRKRPPIGTHIQGKTIPQYDAGLFERYFKEAQDSYSRRQSSK